MSTRYVSANASVLAWVALIGWSIAPAQGPVRPLKLRGPLVEWLEFQPASLSECLLDTVTSYSPPFWRAPYRWCSRLSDSRKDQMQVDADSVVVQVDALWQVLPDQSQEEFARAEQTLASRLGPPQQRCRSVVVTSGRAAPQPRRECCELWAAWFSADTLQATLALSFTHDVMYFGHAGSWIITRELRLGPTFRGTCGP